MSIDEPADRDAGPQPEDPDWAWSSEPLPGHGSRQDRRWALAVHLSIFAVGIGFPLAVVVFRGHRSPYVCHQAVEALNFQTTVLLAVLACSLASAVLVGLVMLPLVLLGAGTLAVRAALSVQRGAWHRYPCTLRFVS